MAQRKSTIRHNPLAALTTSVPLDEAAGDDVAQVQPADIAIKVAVEPEPTPTETVALPSDVLAETPPPARRSSTYGATISRRDQAVRIVRSYMGWSTAAGLLPLPGLDITGVAAVQVKMLHAMAGLYGVAFDRALARQLVLALISGGGSMVLVLPIASAAKALPVVGTMASMLLSPAVSAMSCFATGHAFLRHFEAGGTLETFEPAKARAEADGA
jgi:uncharacterized protein (DUF697 family)